MDRQPPEEATTKDETAALIGNLLLQASRADSNSRVECVKRLAKLWNEPSGLSRVPQRAIEDAEKAVQMLLGSLRSHKQYEAILATWHLAIARSRSRVGDWLGVMHAADCSAKNEMSAESLIEISKLRLRLGQPAAAIELTRQAIADALLMGGEFGLEILRVLWNSERLLCLDLSKIPVGINRRDFDRELEWQTTVRDCMQNGNPRIALRQLGRGSGMRTCARMATTQLWAMCSLSREDINSLHSTRGFRSLLEETDELFELWRECLRLIDTLRELFSLDAPDELRIGLQLAKILRETDRLPTLESELLAIGAIAKCAAANDAQWIYEQAKALYSQKCRLATGGRTSDAYAVFATHSNEKQLTQEYFSTAAQIKRMAGVTSSLASNAITGWIKQVFAASPERLADIKQKQTNAYIGTMADFFTHAKGILLKGSQIIEFVEFAFPRQANPDLQVVRRQQSTPMDPKISKEIIEREFNLPLKEVFSGWNDVPLAAASIGQVHRARLPNGSHVAVKIKFPSIDRMMRNQLKYLQVIAPFLETLYPGVRIKASLKAMGSILLKELDFELEGKHQEQFRCAVENLTEIEVPKVYQEYCRPGLITMDLIEGTRFWEFAYSVSQEQKNLAGQRIFRGLMHALFLGGVMHSDPHPGNFIFLDDAVGIIDFGSATTKAAHWQKFVRNMVRAVRTSDDGALITALEEIGFLRKQERSNSETDEIVQHFRHNYVPFAIHKPFKFDRDFTSANYKGVHQLIKHLQLPAEAVEPLRFMVGLVSTLTALECEGRFAEILDEILMQANGSQTLDISTAS